KDYILEDWIKVKSYSDNELKFHKVRFELQSSDVGQYGMNTPAYFCLDYDFQIVGVNEVETLVQVNLFPNPVSEQLSIESRSKLGHLRILDIQGSEVFNENLSGNNSKISLPYLTPGIYFAVVHTESGTVTKRFIKQ
ncbi:MAG: T9SS type A sorting domain-containing protein, partial [Bacteroidia bacterium]